MTVNPYLGRDSLEPFLAACRRDGGGHLLPRQDVERGRRRRPGPALSDGRPLWQHVAQPRRRARARSSSASAACRASARSSARRTRARSARRGGCCRRRSCSCRASARRARRPADVARAFTSGPASALVAPSRSVIYAFRIGRGRLARRGGGRGGAAAARGLGRLRLVGERGLAAQAKRYGAPVAFLPRSRSPSCSSARAPDDASPARPRRDQTARPRRDDDGPVKRRRFYRLRSARRSATSRSVRHDRRGAARAQPRDRADEPGSASASASIAFPPVEGPARLRRRTRARGARPAAPPQVTGAPISSRTDAPARCCSRTTPGERVPIASITKLMTVLLTLERTRPSDVVTVSARGGGASASPASDLRAGERMTVRDLVEAALIQSANDAADALADYVGHGSETQLRGADEPACAAARPATTRTSSAPTASTRPATSRARAT